jgi:hypothetical protein
VLHLRPHPTYIHISCSLFFNLTPSSFTFAFLLIQRLDSCHVHLLPFWTITVIDRYVNLVRLSDAVRHLYHASNLVCLHCTTSPRKLLVYKNSSLASQLHFSSLFRLLQPLFSSLKSTQFPLSFTPKRTRTYICFPEQLLLTTHQSNFSSSPTVAMRSTLILAVASALVATSVRQSTQPLPFRFTLS